MKFFKIIIFFSFVISCRSQEKEKNQVQNESVKTEIHTTNKKQPPFDFLDKKYRTGKSYSLDSDLKYPQCNYGDLKLGLVTISYIGKTKSIQDEWHDYENKNNIERNDGLEEEDYIKLNNLIITKLEPKLNNYDIVAEYIEPMYLKENKEENYVYAEVPYHSKIYVFNQEKKKWVYLKEQVIHSGEHKYIAKSIDVINSYISEYYLLSQDSKKTIDAIYRGNFSIRIETEFTTTGMASITYNFTITKEKIVLEMTAVHQFTPCGGEYKAINKDNILELYYVGDDVDCQKTKPLFLMKKTDKKYFIKGVGGEGTFNKWQPLIKEGEYDSTSNPH